MKGFNNVMKIFIFGIFSVLSLIFLGYVFVFYHYKQTTHHQTESILIAIPEGANLFDIADELKNRDLVSSKWAFVLGAWSDGLRGKFFAGEFEVQPDLSAIDIAHVLTDERLGRKRSEQIQVTFPEGWTARQMADRLNANDLPGDVFYSLSQNPSQNFFEEFSFLSSLPKGASLEGFLFPDTYIFGVESSAEIIIKKMLQTFEKKVYSRYSNIDHLYDKVTLASILEGEVRLDRDRKLVSGIFQKRLDANMRLQSCATIAYALGERKVQYTAEDLTVDSPYNTYTNDGLPPGPVSNPSLSSLEASFFPEESEYWFFLNDPETGDTYFAKNFEEHKVNKEKTGL